MLDTTLQGMVVNKDAASAESVAMGRHSREAPPVATGIQPHQRKQKDSRVKASPIPRRPSQGKGTHQRAPVAQIKGVEPNGRHAHRSAGVKRESTPTYHGRS